MDRPILLLPSAIRGEKGAGRALLRDLANRLRGGPTKHECETVAELLIRAADAPPNRVAEALYLSTPHRPRASSIEEHRIAFDVMIALLDAREKGTKASSAGIYASVAKTFGLSASRVKSIWLKKRVRHGDHWVLGMLFPEAGGWYKED